MLRWPLRVAVALLLFHGEAIAQVPDPPRPPAAAWARPVPGGVQLNWLNPSMRVSGAAVEKFYGISLYRDGTYVGYHRRSAQQAGQPDSVLDMHAAISTTTWELYALEDIPSGAVYTPTPSAPTPPIHMPAPGPGFLWGPDTIDVALPLDAIALPPIVLVNTGLDSLSVYADIDVPWLSVVPTGSSTPGRFQLPPVSGVKVGLRLNSSGLVAGTYQGIIRFTSNDSRRSAGKIGIRLELFEMLNVSLTPKTMTAYIGLETKFSIRVLSAAAQTVRYALEASEPWIDLPNGPWGLEPGKGDWHEGRVRPTANQPGTMTGSIWVVIAGPRSSRLEIPLSIPLRLATPSIWLESDTLVIPVDIGSTASTGFEIKNTGAGPLLFRLLDRPDWLDVHPSGTVRVEQGFNDVLDLKVNARQLSPGDHRAQLRLESNDPVRPTIDVHVVARVLTPVALIDSARIEHRVPWSVRQRSVIEERVVVRNSGAGSLVLGPIRLDPPVSWLLPEIGKRTIYPGTADALQFILKPSGVDVGIWTTRAILPTNDIDQPELTVEFVLEVTRVPSMLQVTPREYAFSLLADAPVRGKAISVVNTGSDYMRLAISDDAPWLRASPDHIVLKPGETRAVMLLVAGVGAAIGKHEPVVMLTTDIPEQPPVILGVTVDVLAGIEDIEPIAAEISELWLGCREDVRGEIRSQYVELSGFGTGLLSRNLMLVAESETGLPLFEMPVRLPPDWALQGWPEANSWLIGLGPVATLTGVDVDAVLNGKLDPFGGVITLREIDGEERVLNRISYGAASRRLAGLPGPGQSYVTDTNSGLSAVGESSPRNSLGATGRVPRCLSPPSQLVAGSQTLITRASHGKIQSGQLVVHAGASFDHRTGDIDAGGIEEGSAMTTEVFHLTGIEAGRPVRFDVVMELSGLLSASSSHHGAASIMASLDLNTDVSVGYARSESHSAEISETLRVPITVVSGAPFGVTMTARGNGEFGTTAGLICGKLGFSGLPPGAEVRGNHGYVVEGPADSPVIVVGSTTRYGQNQVRWSTGQPAMLAIVERRVGGGVWQPLVTVDSDDLGIVQVEDRDVVVGRQYAYRLLLGATYVGSTSLVGAPPTAASIGTIVPNPVRGDLIVPVVLTGRGAARLQLFGPTGRLEASIDLSQRPGGDHVIHLSDGGSLASGVYFVRLSTGDQVMSTKVTVVH